MSLYQKIKSAITVRQVGEMYGMEPDRHDMVCCPFHSDSEGYFRFKADYSISSKEFYDIYKQWCEDNACHSVSAIRFSAELRQNDRRYNLEATNNIYLPGGRRVRGFVGIEPLVHPCP